jgi:vacuolar-type H+-ATPase subunit F/Vma7
MNAHAVSTVFIGDELSAAGYRLTGIETVTPAPDDVGAALDDARKRARLVILTADLARHVPAAELEAALLEEAPALAIVPDVLTRTPPPDLAKRLRSALGIET